MYIIKHSLMAPYGCDSIALSMECGGVYEQQTDRSSSNGVRGVIATNIYYLPNGGKYESKVYIDHTTTATVNSNLKILKLQ